MHMVDASAACANASRPPAPACSAHRGEGWTPGPVQRRFHLGPGLTDPLLESTHTHNHRSGSTGQSGDAMAELHTIDWELRLGILIHDYLQSVAI